MSTMSERALREEARRDLIDAIEQLGYPGEFGEVIARELGGEKSMRRMSAYLRGAHPHSPEEIADEMLAIIQLRETWVEQKVSEHANASITAFYNRPRDEDEDA